MKFKVLTVTFYQHSETTTQTSGEFTFIEAAEEEVVLVGNYK